MGLSVWVLLSVLILLGLYLVPNFRNCQLLFPQTFFQPHILPPLLLGLCLSGISEALFIYFLLFSLSFKLYNLYHSIFKFTCSFTCHIHSAIELIRCPYFGNCIFQFYNFLFWFFFSCLLFLC